MPGRTPQTRCASRSVFKISVGRDLQNSMVRLQLLNTMVMTQLQLGVSSWCNGLKRWDCGIVVREFVLQSRYYIHFRANTLGKGIETPYPPSYGLNSTTRRMALALNNLKRVDMPLNKETKPIQLSNTTGPHSTTN